MSKHVRKLQEEFLEKAVRYENDLLCARNGWKAWPKNATEAEKDTALDALLNGQDYSLYPPGYVAEPVETSGKLQGVEQEELRHWWEVWK